MSSYDTLALDRPAEHVLRVTLNRPQVANALNTRMGEEMLAVFDALCAAPDSARCVILTGAGEKAFCAGGDLKQRLGMTDAEWQAQHLVFERMVRAMLACPIPTIAAVNGAAYAGGFLLAQMCDLCLAADHARFAVTEAKVGRGAPWAAPLPWLVPPRAALQILMTAEPIGAARAYEIGLVNEVVPAADLRRRTQEVARTIATNAPLTVRAAKRMVYAAGDAVRGAVFDRAEAIWEPVYLSEDAQEGPRAFSERRPPRWQGR